MRSKKWQHFSTSVPPVLRLKRFQSPTLGRNGKRCSRIASMRSRPTAPRAPPRRAARPGACSGTPCRPRRCRDAAPRRSTTRAQSATRRAERLLDEDVLRRCAKTSCEHVVVSEVRRRDTTASTGARAQQLAVVRVHLDLARRPRASRARGSLVGVGDRRDLVPGTARRLRMCSQPIMPVPMMP